MVSELDRSLTISFVELGYDSDLVIDSDDEKRLDDLPDLKREQEIYERRQKRALLLQRYEFLQQ